MSGEADLLKLGINIGVTGQDQAQALLQLIRDIREELSKPGSSGSAVITREQAAIIRDMGVDLNAFLSVLNQTRSAAETDVNQMIGRFQALGKQIDITSQDAVAQYREEGEALKEVIKQLGNKASAARQASLVETAVASAERRAGSVGGGGTFGAVDSSKTELQIRKEIAVIDAAIAEDHRRDAALRRAALVEIAALEEDIARKATSNIGGFGTSTEGKTEQQIRKEAATIDNAIAEDQRRNTANRKKALLEIQATEEDVARSTQKGFTINNFGARQAANGLAVLALSIDATNLTAQGATRAVIQLAFGLSVLASNAKVAVTAGFIAALFTAFEVIQNLDDVTKKENESLKEFTKTEADFVARSQAVNKVLSDLGNPHDINLGDTFIGITKQVDDLHSAANKARKDLREAFSTPSFSEAFRADVDETAGRVIAFRQETKQLLQQFADGRINSDQFGQGLENIGKKFPDFLPEIIQVSQLGATFKAATDELRRFQAQANQKIAVQNDLRTAFGITPELAQGLDLANQRRNAFLAGGPVAVDAVDKETESLKKADQAWQEYVTTEKGAQFQHIAFRDAYLATGKARSQVLKDLRLETGEAVIATATVDHRLGDAVFNARRLLETARESVKVGAEPADLQAQKEALEKVNADIAVLQADRINGETAAQKVAAQNQTAIRIRQIKDDHKLQESSNDLIAAEEKKLQEELLKIDREAAAKKAKVDADKAVQNAKIVEQTTLEGIKGREDQSTLDLKAQLRSRLITQQQFNQESLQNAVQFSTEIRDTELKSLDEQIKIRKREAKLLIKPEDKQAALDEVTNLEQSKEKVKAAARARELKANGEFEEASAALNRKVQDEAVKVQVDTLRAQGKSAQAAALEQKHRFQGLIDELRDIGTPEAKAIIPAVLKLEGVDTARAQIEGLMQDVTVASDHLNAQLADIHVKLLNHSITEKEAREEIVKAEEQLRDAILESLPALEAQAEILGNTKAADQVLALTTRLAELNEQIRENSDDFFQLKETARNASTSALGSFLFDLTKLGAQDKTEVHELTQDLQQAQVELNQLLAIPAGQRTALQENRIAVLQNQISQVNVQLDSAKDKIKTWRDLFLEAAQSIIDALARVASQMLAVRIIEGLLSLSFGGSDLGSNLSSGGRTAGQLNAAGGGLILGPGTGTSDSIRANVSNREFIEPAASTDYYGADWFELLRRRAIPRALVRTIMRGLPTLNVRTPVHAAYSGGGLVSSTALGLRGATSARQEHYVRVGLARGLIAEEMRSPSGQKATVENIRDNRTGIRGIL